MKAEGEHTSGKPVKKQAVPKKEAKDVTIKNEKNQPGLIKKPFKGELQVENKLEMSQEAPDEEYDEEEDDDYDPEAKVDEENDAEGKDDSDDESKLSEEEKDYSSIQATTTQVKTRSQRNQVPDTTSRYIGKYATDTSGLVQPESNIDVNSIFSDLNKSGSSKEWSSIVNDTADAQSFATKQLQAKSEQEKIDELNPDKIKIESSYAFAGKIITETKLVDANSAEAKAYLNSTSSLTTSKETSVRSYIPVIRTVPGVEEPVELYIKLKRPSLIDKFLSVQGNKKSKLSTLEKSRLDWASFVDHRKIGDDLKIGNRGGYLDTQDFLGRVQYKRDEQYQQAKEVERQRMWKLQQQK